MGQGSMHQTLCLALYVTFALHDLVELKHEMRAYTNGKVHWNFAEVRGLLQPALEFQGQRRWLALFLVPNLLLCCKSYGLQWVSRSNGLCLIQ